MTKPKRAVVRGLIVTPLGHQIFKRVEAGTYKHAPGGILRAGIKLKKRKQFYRALSAWEK